MLKKILGWVKGEKRVDGLQVEVEVVRPEPPRGKTRKTKKSPVKQPDPICPHCSEIKERIFGIEEALEKMPFPSRECEVWTTGSFPFLGRYQLQTGRGER